MSLFLPIKVVDYPSKKQYSLKIWQCKQNISHGIKAEATQKCITSISESLPRFECTLNTMPGVNDITVAKLLSEIGDIRRFSNVDKRANFAGIAPVRFSFAGKGDDNPVSMRTIKSSWQEEKQAPGIDPDLPTAG